MHVSGTLFARSIAAILNIIVFKFKILNRALDLLKMEKKTRIYLFSMRSINWPILYRDVANNISYVSQEAQN